MKKFGIKPPLSIEQFLSDSFTEAKLQLCEECLKLVVEFKRKNNIGSKNKNRLTSTLSSATQKLTLSNTIQQTQTVSDPSEKQDFAPLTRNDRQDSQTSEESEPFRREVMNYDFAQTRQDDLSLPEPRPDPPKFELSYQKFDSSFPKSEKNCNKIDLSASKPESSYPNLDSNTQMFDATSKQDPPKKNALDQIARMMLETNQNLHLLSKQLADLDERFETRLNKLEARIQLLEYKSLKSEPSKDKSL